MNWLILLDPRFWWGVFIAWWALYGTSAVIWILSVLCVSAFIFIGYKYLTEMRKQ